MRLEHILRQIEPDRDNLRHDRPPLSGVADPLWHIDAGGGGRAATPRQPHPTPGHPSPGFHAHSSRPRVPWSGRADWCHFDPNRPGANGRQQSVLLLATGSIRAGPKTMGSTMSTSCALATPCGRSDQIARNHLAPFTQTQFGAVFQHAQPAFDVKRGRGGPHLQPCLGADTPAVATGVVALVDDRARR